MSEQWKVEHQFAWLPVFIRERRYGLFARPGWVWLRRYTRIYEWNGERYRTYDTVLGYIEKGNV